MPVGRWARGAPFEMERADEVNGSGRTPETRLELLEWRAAEAQQDLVNLRFDMNAGMQRLEQKLGRLLFAGWALVAAVVGGALSMIITAAVLAHH